MSGVVDGPHVQVTPAVAGGDDQLVVVYEGPVLGDRIGNQRALLVDDEPYLSQWLAGQREQQRLDIGRRADLAPLGTEPLGRGRGSVR
jgi:hypothetical protein